MALNSSDVSASDDILATHHNLLRQDVREANCDIQTRYLTLGTGDFIPTGDTSLWSNLVGRITSSSNTVALITMAGVHLPTDAIVTSLKVYLYKDDAAASLSAALYRHQLAYAASGDTMASINALATTGEYTEEDTTISNATIDNENYRYYISMNIAPNNSSLDVRFYAAKITYTIVKSLP